MCSVYSVFVFARASACVRACVPVCVRACVRVCVCVCSRASAYMRLRITS